MKKFVLLFGLLVIGTLGKAQTITNQSSSGNVWNFRGGIMIDTMFKVPARTLGSVYPVVNNLGRIQINSANNNLYYHNGTSFKRLLDENNFSSFFNTDFSGKTTDNLPEGTTNLYYTLARFNSAFSAKTTTDLAEGSNLYYTLARFNSAFASKTTSDLTEGSNLYFTDARARSSISLTTTGTSGAATYSSLTGILNVPNYNVTGGTVTSIGLTSTDFTVSGSPVTTNGNITANLTTTGVTAGIYDWVTVDTKGRVTEGAVAQPATAIASGARNFNQAYQVSSTRPSRISVSPQLACALSLSGGQSGTITLEISANGSSGWIYIGQVSGSNTGTLTIGLATNQITGAQLDAYLPTGYYWRLTTSNLVGTPTYTFNGGSYSIY